MAVSKLTIRIKINCCLKRTVVFCKLHLQNKVQCTLNGRGVEELLQCLAQLRPYVFPLARRHTMRDDEKQTLHITIGRSYLHDGSDLYTAVVTYERV